MRHPLLYAEQNWKQTGRLLFFLALAYGILGPVGLTLLAYFQTHRLFAPQALQLLIYVPLAFVVYAAYRYYRWRARIEFADDGVRVFKLYRTAVIPYDSVRGGRVATLRQAYTSGLPKYVPPIKKAFLDKPVLVLRMRGDAARLAFIKRSLGSYYSIDPETAAFPVADPQAAADDLRAHLPQNVGMNLGGAQRRGRRRR